MIDQQSDHYAEHSFRLNNKLFDLLPCLFIIPCAVKMTWNAAYLVSARPHAVTTAASSYGWYRAGGDMIGGRPHIDPSIIKV